MAVAVAMLATAKPPIPLKPKVMLERRPCISKGGNREAGFVI